MKEKTKTKTIASHKPFLATITSLLCTIFFISFALHGCKTSKSTSKIPKNQEDVVFTVAEQMPLFPGGDDARLRFLQENIIYPMVARQKGYQGIVYLSFVVEPDGQITDVRVLKGVHKSIDNEAVRVVKMMPKWVPGKHHGKPVRVQFNMPIKFTLQG